MQVDHWINFKSRKRHMSIDANYITGMEEFVGDRYKLLKEIPEFAKPDFAQINRLPTEA